MHDHLNQLTPAPLTRALHALIQQALPVWSQTTVLRRLRWTNMALFFGPTSSVALLEAWAFPAAKYSFLATLGLSFVFNFPLTMGVCVALARRNRALLGRTYPTRRRLSGWRFPLALGRAVFVNDGVIPRAAE